MTMCGCQAVFQSSELGRKKGPAEIISMLVNGMETKSRLCICMFADEIEGFRFLDPAWILNPSEGRKRSRTEGSMGRSRRFRMGGSVMLGFWEQMSQTGKEKKRIPKGLVESELNFFSRWICEVSLWGIGADRNAGAASQSFERLFSEPPLLWPVGPDSNKMLKEEASWLTSGTLLYMWRDLQFTAKDVVRRGTKTTPRCEQQGARMSPCYRGLQRRWWQWCGSPQVFN